MKAQEILKKIKGSYLFLSLILVIGFLFSSYSIKKTSDYNIVKYMTLVVQHGITDEGYPYQKLTFSNVNSGTQRLYLIRSEMSDKRRNKYFGLNATLRECKLKDRFDNKFVLEEIQKLNQDGWAIKQNNFSVGKSASESQDRPRISESEYISYFLLEKESN